MGSSGGHGTKIFLSAGEASGDLHGASLVRAIRRIDPRALVSCLGGQRLHEAGATVLVDNRHVGVVGIFEISRHLKEIWGAWKRIRAHLLAERPDVIVLIDYPDFNFFLGRFAKRAGIKVFYYISPQIWAWRKSRAHTLKRIVDDMAVILPFEEDFYARYGMKVHYVGHPLLDVTKEAPSRAEARRRYKGEGSYHLVGLLPGSRGSELRLLFPTLLDAASRICREVPGVEFIVPVAPTLDHRAIEKEVIRRGTPARVVSGDTYGVIRASDLLIAVSGTVTLEAAILGAPMIIVNRVSDLTYKVGRWMIQVDWVGLPNLIAGRCFIPELLQKDASPERIASQAIAFLREPWRLDEQKRELERVCGALGEPGVADRVARLVLATAGSVLVNHQDTKTPRKALHAGILMQGY